MNNYFKINIEKIHDQHLNISIIGLGYVGLNLLLHFSKTKNKIYGIDIDKKKISKIKKGKSYINYISDQKIKNVIKKSRFSNNYESIKISDVIILCLPTPLKNNKPDLSYLKKTCHKIKNKLKRGSIIILESTSYPGTTEDFIYKNLNLDNFQIGKNIFLGFSPEREDPGNKKFSLTKIPKVVSGKSIKCLKLIEQIYKLIIPKVVKANSIKVAETSKLLENVYRAVNVTLVNEIKLITDKLKIDIFDVIKIAKTKPFGFQAFYPGPGLGGHCLPIDPLYLSYIAKKLGVRSTFIELTKKINSKIPLLIYSKLKFYLKNKNSRILILGITYKPNVNDLRESAGIRLIEIISKNNKYKVDYSDPYVDRVNVLDKKYKSVKINKQNIRKFDCIVLITNHKKFKYDIIKKNSKLILDTRGKFRVSKKIMRI